MNSNDSIKIMLVDDENVILNQIMNNLPEFNIKPFTSPLEAQKELNTNYYDILIVDQRMPELTGVELLKQARANNCYHIGIMLSAYLDTALIKAMMNQSLIDRIVDKPFEIAQLRIILNESIKKVNDKRNEIEQINELIIKEKSLKNEMLQYQEILYSHINTQEYVNIITQNLRMKELIIRAESYADSKANVLITGESGTGKELFAQLIHYKSQRKNKPFVKINCSAIPDALFESELFGHEKGAFTGAVKGKVGKFEQANGGTLFLDEMGDLPLSQQAKLLRIIEDKEITRIGGAETIKVDVRIISATNRDLGKMIKDEKYREDLFYRMNVLSIGIPSLLERKNDILLLCDYYLKKISNEEGGPEKFLNEAASQYLLKKKFPGNIRELKNMLHRLYFSNKTNEITYEDIKYLDQGNKPAGQADEGIFHKTTIFNEFKDKVETMYLTNQLRIHNNNINQTAISLGLTSGNLCRKLKALEITVER